MSRCIPFAVLALLLSSSVEVRSQTAGVRESLRLLTRGFPIWSYQYETLRQQAASAKIILSGTLVNPRTNPAGEDKNAVTDVHVLMVVKSDPALKDAKAIQLARHIPVPDPKKPPQFLLFCDIFKGRIEPDRMVPLTSDALPKYLKGALNLDPKKPGDAVLFFHRHLDSPSPEVVLDAFYELSALPYEDIRRHAPRLPADTIAARLSKNEKTPDSPCELDGLLLGHCGNARHAALLETMIEKHCKDEDWNGLKGLLIGHMLLRPKEGFAQIRKIVSRAAMPFHVRYQCLIAVRFVREKRPDVVVKEQFVGVITLMLAQPDIADLAIDELQRIKAESLLERVLALDGQEEYSHPIIRRATLHFALTFPKNAKAARFVEACRVKDPDRVENQEERLKLEETPKAP